MPKRNDKFRFFGFMDRDQFNLYKDVREKLEKENGIINAEEAINVIFNTGLQSFIDHTVENNK